MWTANYIAMRAMQESDAFLLLTWALQRAVANDGARPDARQLQAQPSSGGRGVPMR